MRSCYLNNLNKFGCQHLRAYYYFDKFLSILIHPVPEWIDTPELEKNQKFIADWHYFLKDVAASLRKENASDGTIKQINIYVLKEFYMRGFGEEVSFYAQFQQRLKEVKAVLLK